MHKFPKPTPFIPPSLCYRTPHPHTMTSLPHPAHTCQPLPIFSHKMYFVFSNKVAHLYRKTFLTLVFLPSSLVLSFLFTVFNPSVCVSGCIRTGQTVTQSVIGCLCCFWLITALWVLCGFLFFFNMKRQRLSLTLWKHTLRGKILTLCEHNSIPKYI